MANALAVDETQSAELDDANIEQYVTFSVGDELFGFPMASVLEIIRLPTTVEVPLTPDTLVGLANLRGDVLPILDLRRLLHVAVATYDDATRVVVTDIGMPLGLIVDRVSRVLLVDKAQIESHENIQSSVSSKYLAGVIKGDANTGLIQLFNLEALLSDEFSETLSSMSDHALNRQANSVDSSLDETEDTTQQLVSFSVDDQEYAFNLMQVEEIVRLPEHISHVPRAQAHVLGVIDLRGRLLPLVSLRRLFDLVDDALTEDNRILVVTYARSPTEKESIGLVVDDVKEVLRIRPEDCDDLPALLAEQDSQNEIVGICRLAGGQRLVSVLAADKLFDHPMVQVAMAATEAHEDEMSPSTENLDLDEDLADVDEDDNTAQLVVFRLGQQEYAASIDDVQEITRVPEKLERVPKTPKFIEGLVNLRGTVLPVLDMRVRFGMEKLARSDRQRIIVLSLAGVQTGFIVDSVAEVVRLQKSQIETAPNLSKDQARIMGRVVNLKDQARMIQVLAVTELVSKQEQEAMSDAQ